MNSALSLRCKHSLLVAAALIGMAIAPMSEAWAVVTSTGTTTFTAKGEKKVFKPGTKITKETNVKVKKRKNGQIVVRCTSDAGGSCQWEIVGD